MKLKISRKNYLKILILTSMKINIFIYTEMFLFLR